MRKVLVLEDEENIRSFVVINLKRAGYETIEAATGEEALARIKEDPGIKVALLDIMLPDIDGLEICRKIREKHFYPVIMLTAKSEDLDKIMGLTIGADDYITKPFNPLELLARVKTQFRRYETYNRPEGAAEAVEEEDTIDIRGLSIRKATHKCTLNGKELSLTPIEFSILWYLCENRGRVLSSEEIFEKVWG